MEFVHTKLHIKTPHTGIHPKSLPTPFEKICRHNSVQCPLCFRLLMFQYMLVRNIQRKHPPCSGYTAQYGHSYRRAHGSCTPASLSSALSIFPVMLVSAEYSVVQDRITNNASGNGGLLLYFLFFSYVRTHSFTMSDQVIFTLFFLLAIWAILLHLLILLL